MSTIAQNRRAYHEYHVLETLVAGLVLQGTEIKSLRIGKASIAEGFVRIVRGEAWLVNANIQPYSHGTHYNHAPDRSRKLLLKRKEIDRLQAKIKEGGLTLIPTRLYFDRCWAKLEIGLCKGKKLYDKRDSLKQKDVKRDIQRAMKS